MKTEDLKDSKENSLRFKTNIHCSGCVAQVTPHLDQEVGAGHWSVDISSPQKVLTVLKSVDSSKIVNTLKQAGYLAEPIDQ